MPSIQLLSAAGSSCLGAADQDARLRNEDTFRQAVRPSTQVAGTEQGVTEPEATFSACFGGAFLMWHPMKVRGTAAQLGSGQRKPAPCPSTRPHHVNMPGTTPNTTYNGTLAILAHVPVRVCCCSCLLPVRQRSR